jgi:hypothetical protein
MIMSRLIKVTVTKLDHEGIETWRYSGNLVEHRSNSITIEAFFDRADMEFHGITLGFGDRFVETYYFDRWYNIFEIHHKEDDHLKGWYCNVSSPAKLQGKTILYRDLALDLLVFPDGRQIVLDEDEFKNLKLNQYERQNAMAALTELKAYFREKAI